MGRLAGLWRTVLSKETVLTDCFGSHILPGLCGRLRGHSISCPLHGARFDVRTGACLAAPARRPIQSFPVTIEGGKVCVDVTAFEGTGQHQGGPFA